MNVKSLVQITILISIFLILYLVFVFYLKRVDVSEIQNEVKEKSIVELNTDSSSTIKELEYKSFDNRGNEYVISAESATNKTEQSNILILKNVKAEINLVGKSQILIYSDFAEYNQENYDTRFFKKVYLSFEENNAKSNNLDLFFKDNLAIMYNSILFKNIDTEMYADIIELDLVSGDINIRMKEKEKKVTFLKN